MRILFDYRPALRRRTGVGEYVNETARALIASAPPDERLSLFSASWKDRLASDVVPGAETLDARVPVRALHLAWHRLEWPPVEWLAGKHDVVQSAHPLLIPSRHAAQLVTIYDLDFLDAPERTRGEIRRDYPPLAPSHARRADQVITISSHTADAIETRLGVPRSHISICRPGAPDWPRRAAEPKAHGSILFLGTLEPRKNLGVLLDAYSALIVARPDAPPLVLAGQIPAGAEDLVRRARERPLAGHVELPGYVSDVDKAALFRRALVFVLPSHTEGFGMPAIEAMSVGVPVIAAGRGALVESVGDAGTLVSPDNPAELTQALTTILSDASRRDRMREAGWLHVQQFTWARTAAGVREAWHLARDHHAGRRG
ncbi:MAG: glycosyltransferase family 1 protein [Acidobacteriota bacterium]